MRCKSILCPISFLEFFSMLLIFHICYQYRLIWQKLSVKSDIKMGFIIGYRPIREQLFLKYFLSSNLFSPIRATPPNKTFFKFWRTMPPPLCCCSFFNHRKSMAVTFQRLCWAFFGLYWLKSGNTVEVYF